MLSYDEALRRILDSLSPLPAEPVALGEAAGRALARDLAAGIDLPPFDNSMVDGFVVHASDLAADGRRLKIVGEIPAGAEPSPGPPPGAALRLFTGAPTPDDFGGIVMVEDTQEQDGAVRLTADATRGFVRRRGSDIAAGALAVPRGASLGPGEIGLLASLNHATVPCVRRPRVGLLTTGDELIPVGDAPLAPGQIRDSNGPALTAAIAEAGGEVVRRTHARDTPGAVEAAFDTLADCDLILSSGGVSVGDHDHVKAVLERRGRLDFWRIAIRPGKPLAFGWLGTTPFVGLPGNPVSSLVTFELFVRPALRVLGGHANVARPSLAVTLAEPLPHEPGRREFVRVRLTWESGVCRATPTGAQGSHRTHSLVGADALLIADEAHGDYPAGSVLPALLLRG